MLSQKIIRVIKQFAKTCLEQREVRFHNIITRDTIASFKIIQSSVLKSENRIEKLYTGEK